MIDTTFEHSLPCLPADYWRMAFDERLCERLFRRRLQYRAYELVSSTENPDGTVTRVTRGEPAPRKGMPSWLAGKLSYEQRGHFDPKASRYVVKTTSAAYPTVEISGSVDVVAPTPGYLSGAVCLRKTRVVLDASRLSPLAVAMVEPILLRRLRISLDQTASFYREVLAS